MRAPAPIRLCRALAPVLLLLAAGLSNWLPLARFDREQIDIQVHRDHIFVEGVYFYRNPYPFPIVQGLSIPLPEDALHPAPVQIEVQQLSPGPQSLPLRNLWGSPRFDLRLRSHETICVRVRYYQLAPTSDARYILTTTRPWLRPLESAEYSLLPVGVTLVASNYPLIALPGGTVGFRRTHFLPRRDWIFSWRTP